MHLAKKKKTPRFRSPHSASCQKWQGPPSRWAHSQRPESADKQPALQMLTYTMGGAPHVLFVFAKECTGNLARLWFVMLLSITVTSIPMTSYAGSSGKLGIAFHWFLDWRFWIICIYQNHWAIIFVYSFVLRCLFDWISGI